MTNKKIYEDLYKILTKRGYNAMFSDYHPYCGAGITYKIINNDINQSLLSQNLNFDITNHLNKKL